MPIARLRTADCALLVIDIQTKFAKHIAKWDCGRQQRHSGANGEHARNSSDCDRAKPAKLGRNDSRNHTASVKKYARLYKDTFQRPHKRCRRATAHAESFTNSHLRN